MGRGHLTPCRIKFEVQSNRPVRKRTVAIGSNGSRVVSCKTLNVVGPQSGQERLFVGH